MLVDRWDSIVVPDDLTAFHHEERWLVTNPALAAWTLVSTWEYEVLRMLSRRVNRDAVLASLSAWFAESAGAAELRLEKSLARYVLSWIVYLPGKVPTLNAPEHRLRTVYYATTEGCNLRCPYCYVSAEKAKPGELTTSEALDLVDQAADLGCEEFIFTGGEALLRMDLFALAARSRNRGMRTNVITNGTLIKTPLMAARVAEHFDVVTVSVDGGTAAVHELTRGKGTFTVITQALRLLNAAGVVPKINHVVGPNNVDHLEETVAFLSGFRIAQTRMLDHAPLGRGLRDGQDIDWMAYLKIHRFAWGSSGAKKAIPDGPKLPEPCSIRFNCGLGGTEIYVDSSGNVYPCKLVTSSQYRAGNVREAPLRAIYDSPVLAQLRENSVQSFHDCAACYVRGACGGGCRAYHAGYSGGLQDNSESFCRTLRHRIVTNMWAASRVTGDALLDEDQSAYVPISVRGRDANVSGMSAAHLDAAMVEWRDDRGPRSVLEETP